jgi:hypothetical protein
MCLKRDYDQAFEGEEDAASLEPRSEGWLAGQERQAAVSNRKHSCLPTNACEYRPNSGASVLI